MGVVVVQQKFRPTTTTEIPLANGLLTHEQALKVLAGAVGLLRQPSQDMLELQRLHILVDAMQRYDSVLEKFGKWIECAHKARATLDNFVKLSDIIRVYFTYPP